MGHKDFAVFGQLRAKEIFLLIPLPHTQNAPVAS